MLGSLPLSSPAGAPRFHPCWFDQTPLIPFASRSFRTLCVTTGGYGAAQPDRSVLPLNEWHLSPLPSAAYARFPVTTEGGYRLAHSHFGNPLERLALPASAPPAGSFRPYPSAHVREETRDVLPSIRPSRDLFGVNRPLLANSPLHRVHFRRPAPRKRGLVWSLVAGRWLPATGLSRATATLYNAFGGRGSSALRSRELSHHLFSYQYQFVTKGPLCPR